MRAGFFVWEPGGTVNASQSYLEFSFPDRLAAVFDHRGSSAGRKAPEPRSTFRPANPLTAPAPEVRVHPQSLTPDSSTPPSLFEEPVPEPKQAGSGKAGSARKWLWLVAALIVIAALSIAGERYLHFGAATETIGLSVLEREGQLDIEWNHAAGPVSNAIKGTLEIADGPQTRTIPLASAELALGKFSYKRDTGDIQVRMSVETADGKKVQEASRFLGPGPSKANAEELQALQQRRDELEAEVARLKQSNDQQAQRIQQLERTLKILQTRPGIN
jgi:hypothetical protein